MIDPRLSVDGYICNKNQIDILAIWDSIYFTNNPTKFHYLIYPSKHLKYEHIIRKKYVEVIKELHLKTGCNNQFLNIEFFIINGKIKVMEINPRIGTNYLPIYHITGYDVFNFLI